MNSDFGRDLADLADRRFGRAVRIDPHVVGGHQAAGRVFVVGDQFAQIARPSRRSSRASSSFCCSSRQLAEQIGGVVGVHLFDDVGGALGAEIVDDRALRFGVEMFERVGGGFVVELSRRRGRLRAPKGRR